MWELNVSLPFGRISKRNIFTFAAAMIVAIFACTFLLAPTTHAEDASWIGSAISYNSNQYIKQSDVKQGDGTGLPAGTHIYTFTEQPQAGSTDPQKIHVISFPPNTDPTKETSASYAVYDFTPPSTFKNGTGQQTISLTAQTAKSQKTTSCDGTFTMGIGWIVCPVTNFLASAMDWLFGILSSFMTVRPVQTTQENSLFRAWSYMRNFANVAFVIAFLVIIYSQISNVGLSTYHIKKMLPRLVIAAILVNISYWICAIAIDISNILGYSIQDIFVSLRNGIVGAEGNGWNVTSWKSVSGFVLSGGVGVAAAGIGLHVALAGAVGGAIYMLVPILLGVLLAALVALLILAARQAIITILVIISPLAFVAYILPNTEKYFKRWHELGMTMLIMFPAFSVIFGGAQLAGIAIIQNADSINLIILGMAVQVAPVAITPLLLRFSGSLLTRIAGMVNNPNKGLLDRTRNWSQERADQHKARVLANPTNRRRDFLARATQAIDNKDRKRKGWQAAHNSMADARWANSHDSHAIHQASEEAKMLKETGEAVGQAAFERLRTQNGHRVQLQDVNLRVSQLDLDVAKAEGNAQWENLRTRAYDGNQNNIPTHLQQEADIARQRTLGAAVVASQIKMAQHEQQQDFAAALKASEALQADAGGISALGADSVLASAIATERKAYNDSVAEARQIVKHFNLPSELRQDHAKGIEVTATDSAGNVRVFKASDTFTREAVIEDQIKTGTVEQAQELVGLSGSQLADFKTSISAAVAEAGLGAKTVYLGGSTINEITKGAITSPEKLTGIIQDTIAKGKISSDNFATIDKDAVKSILKAAAQQDTSQMDPTLVANLPAAIAELKANARYALDDPILKGKVKANVRPLLEQIRDLP